MGRNGKIAQLPKAIREQLNTRLDNGEKGKDLVAWLNSLPEAQTVISKEFNGKPISEENLSQWKKYGYRHWQALQERLECVQALREEAAELGGETERADIKRSLSEVLTAELARSLRDALELSKNPEERAQRLAQLVGAFTRLRREETRVAQTEVVQKRFDWEVAKEDDKKGTPLHLLPQKAYLLQQAYLHLCATGLPEGTRISDGRIRHEWEKLYQGKLK